ncbi:MAG: hypothetical protein ACJA2S_000587 [Cyclobacteriaceae bacterium]|jgi:hypothetical protein
MHFFDVDSVKPKIIYSAIKTGYKPVRKVSAYFFVAKLIKVKFVPEHELIN